MRTGAFPAASSTADWHQPFYVKLAGGYAVWNPPDDEVILGLSPDAISWDDYGARRSTFPPGRAASSPPFFRASSNDGRGYITLISPGLVDILIPASVMRGFPARELNVGIRYERASDGRTSSLFSGRLPIIHGGV